jgi:hypothetical protein
VRPCRGFVLTSGAGGAVTVSSACCLSGSIVISCTSSRSTSTSGAGGGLVGSSTTRGGASEREGLRCPSDACACEALSHTIVHNNEAPSSTHSIAPTAPPGRPVLLGRSNSRGIVCLSELRGVDARACPLPSGASREVVAINTVLACCHRETVSTAAVPNPGSSNTAFRAGCHSHSTQWEGAAMRVPLALRKLTLGCHQEN